MNAVTETAAAEPVSGVEIFLPLAKLKKSPRNARKVPHGEAAIEALAASIQHKGLIQNLVVEPETKDDGAPTGYYLVTAGEGRRLAMLLRAKRKQIRKSEPVRCWLDTANDPAEVSLDENVTRTPMLGHVSRLSFDRKNKRMVCLFQAARSAYPKSWRRAAWNKHLRG
ncbi:ParB/Srx family N-terminal domain-containing protein, partial [Sphingobium yanoikuyae]|uniref:ParB/Srx family N-terminal domain-containing protein n=1 Tax=Sphingobium yanoikuyae TaxID=13690 RepID=UPI001F275675